MWAGQTAPFLSGINAIDGRLHSVNACLRVTPLIKSKTPKVNQALGVFYGVSKVAIRLGGLQRRVVDVAFRSMGVESLRVGLIERGVRLETFRQVRVGDVRHAKGHGVCFASSQQCVGAV